MKRWLIAIITLLIAGACLSAQSSLPAGAASPEAQDHAAKEAPDRLKDEVTAKDPAIKRYIDSRTMLNAKMDFGCYGDGHHDDTHCLQAAFAAVAPTGRGVSLPAGTYLISAPLEIPFGSGYRILGESRISTIIMQSSDNTPIFVFDHGLSHDFEVSNLNFTWSHRQPKTNTEAVAMKFYVEGGGEFFDFDISNIICGNGYRCFQVKDFDKKSTAIFGFNLTNFVGQGSLSGATIYIGPSAIGLPRCGLHNIYNTQTVDEPVVTVHYCGGIFENIEANNSRNLAYDFQSSYGATFRGVDVEAGTLTPGNDTVINLANSWATLNMVGGAIHNHSGGRAYLIKNIAGGGSLTLNGIRIHEYEDTSPGSSFAVVRVHGVSSLSLDQVDATPPSVAYFPDDKDTISALTRANGVLFKTVLANANNMTTTVSSAATQPRNIVVPDANGTLVVARTGKTGPIGGSLLQPGSCAQGSAMIADATSETIPAATPQVYPGDAFTWQAFVSSPGRVAVAVCNRGLSPSVPRVSSYAVSVTQ